MFNLIDDASFLLGSCLQNCVGSNVIDEVLTKISGKIREALITQRLHAPNDSGGVNVVTFSHLSRREEKCFFVFVQNLPDQTTSAATQRGCCKAYFERGERRPGAIQVATIHYPTCCHGSLLLSVWRVTRYFREMYSRVS